MIHRFLRILFAALLVLATGFVLVTTDPSAGQIASHFNVSGQADAFMSGNNYRLFTLFFAVGFPLIIVVLISRVPRLFPGFMNIPNRDYWFAPEQRTQTFAFLEQHALLLGCMLILFCCGVLWLVVLANAQSPPRLANGPFLAMLAVFFIAVCAWLGILRWRFRNIRQ